ncbi:MAG: precorrin-8X methylmutase [Synechococcales bacterium]|nr:precorrin-8X methylmutase [Synechococcales bacterium]
MSELNHPIVQQSFAIIDRELGPHGFTPAEYAIVRRVIHSTADFEFAELLRFSPDGIDRAIAALQSQTPIITDVGMVAQGIRTMVTKTFQNPIHVAVEQVSQGIPGKTRTETGLLTCLDTYPGGIYVIGNAPTALLALCDRLTHSPSLLTDSQIPALVIGAPVGFVAVEAAKAALAQTAVPQIRVEGRKGGSPVAAAILNALLVLAWEGRSPRD